LKTSSVVIITAEVPKKTL